MLQNDTKILMVANWKMNPKSKEEAEKIYTESKKLSSQYKKVTTVVCPSFVHLPLFGKKTGPNHLLGAQDCFPGKVGSETGHVSVEQIKNSGASYCIVGHSEQRAKGETDQDVSQKIVDLLKQGLIPILCVGEPIRDDKGAYLSFVEDQVTSCFEGVPKSKVSKVVIAYEPLWAIGSQAKGVAKPEEVEEMVIAIRRTLSDMYSFKKVPENIILYGGSVSTKKDVQTIISEGKVGGCLVGRASLKISSWKKLLEAANDINPE